MNATTPGGTKDERRPLAPRFRPKGRQVDPEAQAAILALLAGRPRRRDLLIEHLHAIQDGFGSISAAHLAALAFEMRLAQAEVYEVATFYAHFDVVEEGETPPPALTVRICEGAVCELAGAAALKRALVEDLAPGARVLGTPCVGGCDRAPVAVVGRRQLGRARSESVAAAVTAGATDPDVPAFRPFEIYLAEGGYATLRAIEDGALGHEQALRRIEASGLCGLGGAGFPMARKAGFVRAAPKPRILAVNADEGEPGTFKDRQCLETDPHRVLEGALIAARCIEAEAVYVYLRDEYAQIRAFLPAEIAKVEAAGLSQGLALHLRRGAGAYICGEETAMLESLEGKRGLPRNRPPFPAEAGLFGLPTLVSNVETLYWLRDILERGADWYREEGRPRLYSVSGRVADPGVKRAPSGVTARELIEGHAGGMLMGHTFAAYLPGGASGGILPARLADLPLDFGALEDAGAFVGSGAVVVLSDADDVRAVARNLVGFFEDESCGQCTPCRVGCEKLLALMAGPTWDAALIGELAEVMRDASICGLGQAAPNPALSVLRHFAGDGQ